MAVQGKTDETVPPSSEGEGRCEAMAEGESIMNLLYPSGSQCIGRASSSSALCGTISSQRGWCCQRLRDLVTRDSYDLHIDLSSDNATTVTVPCPAL